MSAPAAFRRGTIVEAVSSSALMMMTLPGPSGTSPSGMAAPRVTAAARLSVTNDLPSLGSPANRPTAFIGTRLRQSQAIGLCLDGAAVIEPDPVLAIGRRRSRARRGDRHGLERLRGHRQGDLDLQRARSPGPWRSSGARRR